MKLLVCTQAIDVDHPILGFFHGWVLEFAKHSEVVHVICLEVGRHTLPENVIIHSLGKEAGKSRLTYLWRFYTVFGKLFFTRQVDHVFYHMGAIYNILGAPFFFVRKLYGVKFYWWKTHGLLNTQGKIALSFTDLVFTAGSKSFPYKTHKLVVVGHAIDTEKFTYASKNDNHTILKALIVGRITPIKEIEVAIKAIVGLAKKGTPLHLDIIGTDTDMTYRHQLEALIAENTVTGLVHFVGSKTQTELIDSYHEADFLFHPASQAGFDKVVLEAMSSGVIPLTSIASFEPILSEFGLYIQPQNVDGYVNHVFQLINNSRIADQTKLAIRKIVEEKHSVKTLPYRLLLTDKT